MQTPKGRCEKLQSVDPARRGRSNVSLIYLLQRPRVSPNYVRGALVKLSTKKNRFPHTFSKAPCSGMRTSRGRVHPPLDAHLLEECIVHGAFLIECCECQLWRPIETNQPVAYAAYGGSYVTEHHLDPFKHVS